MNSGSVNRQREARSSVKSVLRTADTTASQSVLSVGARPIDDFEHGQVAGYFAFPSASPHTGLALLNREAIRYRGIIVVSDDWIAAFSGTSLCYIMKCNESFKPAVAPGASRYASPGMRLRVHT